MCLFFPVCTADLHYSLWSFLDPGCNGWQCLHSVPESQKPGVAVCQVGFAGQKRCAAHIPVEIGPCYLVEMGEKAVILVGNLESWGYEYSQQTAKMKHEFISFVVCLFFFFFPLKPIITELVIRLQCEA